MQINLEHLFAAYRKSFDLSEKEDIDIKGIIYAIKAFSRSTSRGIYLIDLHKKEIIYAHDNLSHAWNIHDMQRNTLNDRRIMKLPDEEIETVKEIHSAAWDFLEQITPKQRTNHTLSYDMHISDTDKKERTYNFHFTPILLTQNAIRLVLCSVVPSHSKEIGNIRLRKSEENNYFEYDIKKTLLERTEMHTAESL